MMPKLLLNTFVLFLIATCCCEFVRGVSNDVFLTFHVYPGKQECFHEFVKHDHNMLIEYTVVAASQGGYDVNFQITDQNLRPVLTEFRKRQSERTYEVKDSGIFRFCFDNTFSHLSRKTVAFQLTTEDNKKKIQWEELDQGHYQPEEVYDMTVNEIEASVNRVRVQLNTVQNSQSRQRNVETRDRTTGESNFTRINFWSMVNLILVIIVGLCQVIMLKGLFDEKYNVKKVIKQKLAGKLY